MRWRRWWRRRDELLLEGGEPLLIDFGAARQVVAWSSSSSSASPERPGDVVSSCGVRQHRRSEKVFREPGRGFPAMDLRESTERACEGATLCKLVDPDFRRR
jgi:hypothetical protein